MDPNIQLNSEAKLSDHFTLGEMTKSSSHPEVYNIPSHEAIANYPSIKNTLLHVVEAGCFSINCGGEGILTADSHILL